MRPYLQKYLILEENLVVFLYMFLNNFEIYK